jgi:Fe-S oxidoreductase
MCPVFRALGDELGSSRAKANVLNFWATGQMDDEDFESPEFRKFLDLCVNCKQCLKQCPSGMDISTLMATARTEYVRRKGLRKTEHLLSNNRFLSVVGSAFSPISNLFMGLPIFKWFLERAVGIDKRRQMPAFRRGSFTKAARKYLAACEPIANPIDRVAYFVDAYANHNDHELGFAVIDVLRHNGIEVTVPDQLPSPLPAMVYGDLKRAKKDLQHTVKHLADAVLAGNKIICSEPSAALCLRDELRHYVTGIEAGMVSENTYELMSYLHGMYEHGKLKKPGEKCSARYEGGFAYHLPCHLSAVDGNGASIELLRELCGISVVDLAAGCCGLSGTFGMQKKNYDLSDRISESLKAALENSPTRNVLTECAACAMQIQHISGSIVRHPIKILDECYRSD